MTPFELLHRLWTKAVGTPDYNKEDWKRLEAFVGAAYGWPKFKEAALRPEERCDAGLIHQYEVLVGQYLVERAQGEFKKGPPGEARENVLLEQMDDAWWKMPETDRDEVDHRLARLRCLQCTAAASTDAARCINRKLDTPSGQ